jgi:DNA-binding CsgD family transcriptional regulator
MIGMIRIAGTASSQTGGAPGPFVGDGTLADALSRAERGAAIVIGEPGAGKSRLLAEAARLRRARGGETVSVVCLPAAAQVPFDPLIALAKSLAARGRLTVRAARAIATAGDARRLQYLYDALERAAEVGPLALHVDDLHHADQQTLDAIHYCAERLRAAAVVWNLALRPGCTASDELGAQLARAGLARVVEIGALDAGEAGRLARAHEPQLGTDAEADARLHERAGGNPLYVELLLRAEAGDTAPLRRALDERLRALAPDALAVAGAVARLGGTAPVAALGVPLSAERVDAALAALVEQRVLRRAAGGFRFRHGVLREACAGANAATPAPPPAGGADDAEAALARWEHAPDDAATLPALERAAAASAAQAPPLRARLLLALGAAYESAGALERARETLERASASCDDEGDRGLAIRLRARRAAVQGRLGNPHDGVAMLEAAAEEAAAHGLGAEAAACCAELCALSETLDDAARYERWCRFGLDAARSAPAAARAPLVRGSAQVALAAGRLREARALAATAAGGAGTSPVERGEALCLHARIAAMQGDFGEAGTLLDEARRLDVPERALPALELAGALVAELHDDPRTALARFTAASANGREDGRRDARELAALAGVVRCACALGLRAQAADAAAQLRAAARFGWPLARRYLHEADGFVALLDGDAARGCEELLRAAERGCDSFHAAALLLRVAGARKDRALFLRVIERYDALGAVHAAGAARAAARAHGLRPGRTREPQRALSAREDSVATLVAAGMTNNEIGALLHITARTVEYHVGNILTKCGLRSRVEVATRVAAGRLRGTASDDAPPA